MMARPTKHDKINLDRLREAAASCGSLEDIAAALRLSVRTFFTARENDPEIDEIIAEARQETHQLIANKLIDAAKNGSVEAAKFLLERKFAWHKVSKQELEFGGKAAPSICIKLTTASGEEIPTQH